MHPAPEQDPAARGRSRRSAIDGVLRLCSLLGAATLAFLAGSWLTHEDRFPYRDHLRKAFIGAETLFDASGAYDDDFPPPKADDREWRFEVAAADGERAAAGLTLISYGQKAELVDLDGRVRHAWHADFRRLLDERDYRREGQRFKGVLWRNARLLPGGDLLVVLSMRHVTPYGLALARLDRDSRPRFVYRGSAHHDLDVAPDGRILVLSQRIRATAVPGLRPFRPPLFDELLVELSAEGELLREFSLVEALAGTPFAPILRKEVARLRYAKGDYLHPNNVDVVDADAAARFPFAREGQVLLSFRELNALAMLDPGSGKVTWMRRGEWVRQHDPDFLPNGNLLIFDNQGDLDRRGGSRVIEYDPRSRAVVWQYPSAEGHRDVRTVGKGDSQRLPNGNTLVNSYGQGWLFEVTRDGEIVWEGFCRIPGERRPVCGIESAMRVPAAAVDFPLNEGVVPGSPGPP